MCVHAASGALRLEPQFGGDSIVVPQGTAANLQDGQLASLAADGRGCGCDALDVKHESAAPAPPPPNSASRIPLTQTEPAAPQPPPQVAENKPPPPTPGEQPIWKIYPPPLTYDASAANAPAKSGTMPPPTPETALLFREVYAEPMIVWHGEVEAPPKQPPPTVAQTEPPTDVKPAAQPEKKPSFGTRVSNFFRRMFGGKPKQEKPSGESQPAAGLVPAQTATYIPS